MAYELGERVGAFLSIEGDTKSIKFLGYGVYDGEHVPPYPSPMLGAYTWEELDKQMEEDQPDIVATLKEQDKWPIRMTNPRVILDNGDIVWGQECWWGSEEAVKEQIEKLTSPLVGYTLEEVKIDEVRQKAGINIE